jgi:hypothetical protein
MIILVLTFITLFLALFSPALVILHRCGQTKGFSDWKERQQDAMETADDAAWRRNKQMILG